MDARFSFFCIYRHRDFLNMQLLGVVFAAVKSKNGKKIAERERESGGERKGD